MRQESRTHTPKIEINRTGPARAILHRPLRDVLRKCFSRLYKAPLVP